jgi:hypothetical protein
VKLYDLLAKPLVGSSLVRIPDSGSGKVVKLAGMALAVTADADAPVNADACVADRRGNSFPIKSNRAFNQSRLSLVPEIIIPA